MESPGGLARGMAVGPLTTLIPTEEEVVRATETYVRRWLVEFVRLDQEAQTLVIADIRELPCGCGFHEAFLDALEALGERLIRVRRPPEGV